MAGLLKFLRKGRIKKDCSGLTEAQETQVRWSSSWIGTQPACMPVPADKYGQRGQRLQEIKEKLGCIKIVGKVLIAGIGLTKIRIEGDANFMNACFSQ